MRRQLTLTILLTCLVLLTIAGALIIVRNNNEDSDRTSISPLRMLLASPECARNCWDGVQPGVTTIDELVDNLTHNRIAYTFRPYLDSDAAATIDILYDKTLERPILVSAYDDKVSQIALSMAVCVSRILDEFGIPDGVYKYEDQFFLGYSEFGLVFEGDLRVNPLHTGAVFLRSEELWRIYEQDSVFNTDWDAIKENFDEKCEDNIENLK